MDGGVNEETGKEVVRAGANLLAAGKYIFSSRDVKSSIEILRGLTS